jgi:sec-independent protein translocase protein TatB
MFDISWGELMLIGVVALIVIGPKELPSVLRMVGQWVARIRRMAAEFQSQFQEAMREAEMADLKKQVDELNETARGMSAHFDPLEANRTAASKPADTATPATADAAQARATEQVPATEQAPATETVPAQTLSDVPVAESSPQVPENEFAPASPEPSSSAPAPREVEEGRQA